MKHAVIFQLQRGNIPPSYTHWACPCRHKGFILPFTNYFTSQGTAIAAKRPSSPRPLPHPREAWNKGEQRGHELLGNKCWGGLQGEQIPASGKPARACVGHAIAFTLLGHRQVEVSSAGKHLLLFSLQTICNSEPVHEKVRRAPAKSGVKPGVVWLDWVQLWFGSACTHSCSHSVLVHLQPQFLTNSPGPGSV